MKDNKSTGAAKKDGGQQKAVAKGVAKVKGKGKVTESGSDEGDLDVEEDDSMSDSN